MFLYAILPRYWSMLVTQIPCSKGSLQAAAPGCRQYLTGVTGTFQSFNFANTNNPQLLAGTGALIQSIYLGFLLLLFTEEVDVQSTPQRKIASITLHNFALIGIAVSH